MSRKAKRMAGLHVPMRQWPRWIEKCRANMGGYFWLPCPVCGEMFSGREVSKMIDRGEHPGSFKDGDRSKVCCPKHVEDYFKDDRGRMMQSPPRHLRTGSVN